MNSDTTLHIGIASREAIQRRTIAIAAGKIKPAPGDPKIWFTSPKMIAQLLSSENMGLLRTIQDINPPSVSSLADATGRTQGNLSRTLKAMTAVGLVEMVRENRQVRPVAKANRIHLEIEI